jgi:hypothetical protein
MDEKLARKGGSSTPFEIFASVLEQFMNLGPKLPEVDMGVVLFVVIVTLAMFSPLPTLIRDQL